MNIQPKKIGIFAGTFDPIHEGHLAFAKQAIVQAGLDTVVIVAEKEPYRKKPQAAWDHRQAMIERATEAVGQVDHDYEFANQLAHQHTMKDMLSTAKKKYGAKHEFWFLVGSDLFEHMHKWHDVASDSDYGGFVVALRDDHTSQWIAQKQQEVANTSRAKSIIISNDHPHVSSSGIRNAIRNQTTVSHLPQAVEEYVSKHQLYQ